MTDSTGRRVTANLALSLDGRYHGPAGAMISVRSPRT